MSSRSCGVSTIEAAPIQPSTCAGLRAPTMAPVTPGQASVHAMAIAATPVPRRCATGFSASTRALAAQPPAGEIGRARAPIVRRQRCRALGGELAGEQARLHRAVDDDAGLV